MAIPRFSPILRKKEFLILNNSLEFDVALRACYLNYLQQIERPDIYISPTIRHYANNRRPTDLLLISQRYNGICCSADGEELFWHPRSGKYISFKTFIDRIKKRGILKL